ncbi:MAG: hypothetical protein J0M36_03850 [Caulobacterales bacterium]|nr:hypothetical protein [Caulobacterales bacterium]
MRRLFVLALTAALFGAPTISLAQNVAGAQQIESWSQAKVIAMGREIYRQDRAAWLATDALLAALSQAELADVRGWIVVPTSTGDLVRFLAADDAGVRARWDIIVGVDSAGPVVAAPSPDLSADEIGRWTARQTAIANMSSLRCGPKMNSVVARDPDSDGWIVWLLTATTESGVIPLGGHQRFRISADGRTVLSRENLSVGCLNMQPPAEADEGAIVFVTHLVSDGPVETHIFLSIQNQIPIAVGVKDRVFIVLGDQIEEHTMPEAP